MLRSKNFNRIQLDQHVPGYGAGYLISAPYILKFFHGACEILWVALVRNECFKNFFLLLLDYSPTIIVKVDLFNVLNSLGNYLHP